MILDSLHKVESIHSGNAQTYEKLAADTGLLIIRSMITLNGGALLAFPAFLGAISKAGLVEVLHNKIVLLAAAMFVIGLLLSLLAGVAFFLLL